MLRTRSCIIVYTVSFMDTKSYNIIEEYDCRVCVGAICAVVKPKIETKS